MEKSIKVALLFDKSNMWLEKHISRETILQEVSEKTCCIDVFFEYEQIVGYDVVFILGFTKIIKSQLLSNNSVNLVVHESALPEGKGFAPVQWQILQGKRSIVVSLIEAGEKVDSGDIILQDIMKLSGYELWSKVREKQAKVTLSLITKFLNIYPDYTKQAQEGEETFFAKRTDKDDELDADKTLREQFNHFRIANNEEYPLYFFINDKKYHLKIYNASEDGRN